MDYKEKYEEALKAAKAGRSIEDIFPELKETEDERIRKFLIEGIRYLSEESLFFSDMSKDKVLSWLEKQGEQKPSTSVNEFDAEVERFCKECFITDANEKGKVFCIARHFADWQKNRQKPAWSEEDIRNLQDIDSILFYDRRLTEDVRTRLRNFLKFIKDRYFWKPSDEQIEALLKLREE